LGKHIISLAEHFGVPVIEFENRKLLNSTINVDTNLFIDPTLFKKSEYEIFRNDARKKYETFFDDLKKKAKLILKLAPEKQEKAIASTISWICAKETVGVCLGYSLNSNRGSGIGPDAAEKVLRSALGIFEQEIDDPMIFSLLHLLEDGIGPDYISDLASKIILKELCIFTVQMSEELGIPHTTEVDVEYDKFFLPTHPILGGPIFILPRDILSDLPIENNFKKVLGSYSRTADEIKTSINEDIAGIYASCSTTRTSEVKEALRDYIYNKPAAIQELITHFESIGSEHYDFENDKLGINFAAIFEDVLDISSYKLDRNSQKLKIIDSLINDFKSLLDNNNDIKRTLLWTAGKRKPESAWQSVLHLFVDRILAKNDIELTPESETGSGPVDFKFSAGSTFRVLIEMKLSSNPNYVHGLEKQMEKYKACTENIKKAYYLYIDLEEDPQKSQQKIQDLYIVKDKLNLNTEIIIIDGRINPSASKI